MPRRADAIITPNDDLRGHRRRLPSPRRAGQPLSRRELAEAVNLTLRELFPGPGTGALQVDSRWVGKLERGEHRWPCEERRAALRKVTGVATDAEIGLYSPRLVPGDTSGGMPGQRREIDITAPHPARRYNYWLGGKDHFAADRESADAIAAVFPSVVTAARENRAFLRRAVRYLAGQGIRQFADIGAGLPAAENTHEIAQAVAPDSRVLYVDNCPIVMAHARALLAGDPQGRIDCLEADLREPQPILEHPALDPGRPVGLLLIGVLHFVTDDEVAASAVKELVSGLPSGSFLALSHATADFLDPAVTGRLELPELRPRSRKRIADLLNGLTTVEPGLVPVCNWRVDAAVATPAEVANYGVVARLP